MGHKLINSSILTSYSLQITFLTSAYISWKNDNGCAFVAVHLQLYICIFTPSFTFKPLNFLIYSYTVFKFLFSVLHCNNASSLLTWRLGVVSKQLRLLHGRVGDSVIVVNSLSTQMSELVEDAIAS